MENLRPAAAWVDLGISVACKVSAAWSALAPLLSWWKTRKEESPGFIAKLADILSLGRSLAQLWKSWR